MTIEHKPHIIIIGGTSGIGFAMAKEYLHRGWHVTIVGSNADKITQSQQILATLCKSTELQNNQANVVFHQCDITHVQQLYILLETLREKPFDILLYSAGWYLNERKYALNKDDSTKMLAVNLQAFQQIFAWASEQLKATNTSNVQKHLVCLASVAGMLSYADASLYAKCKHAMIASSEAYRMALEPFTINVTCIASGYVDTEQLRVLNEGDASHKPFIISEETAVQEIHYAMTENLAVYCFPQQMNRIIRLLNIFPKPLLNKFMTWQYRKQDST